MFVILCRQIAYKFRTRRKITDCHFLRNSIDVFKKNNRKSYTVDIPGNNTEYNDF